MTPIPDSESGYTFAEAAHAAGAVVTPIELPNYDVTVTFRVHGTMSDAADAADKVVGLALEYADTVEHSIRARS